MDLGGDGFEPLNRGERNALKCFANFDGFEPPSKHGHIGLPSLRSLVEKGFAEEGQASIFGPVFKLTDVGRLASRSLRLPSFQMERS
jgi:hypothetical protein